MMTSKLLYYSYLMHCWTELTKISFYLFMSHQMGIKVAQVPLWAKYSSSALCLSPSATTNVKFPLCASSKWATLTDIKTSVNMLKSFPFRKYNIKLKVNTDCPTAIPYQLTILDFLYSIVSQSNIA